MIEEVINEEMEALGIPYQLMEYRDTGQGIPDCYYVGENLEDPVSSEDGGVSGAFILSGWSKSPASLSELFKKNGLIKARFMRPVRIKTDAGAVVLEYASSAVIPCDADGVARIETTINYHEWSVI